LLAIGERACQAEAAIGEVGELCFRNPVMTPGYWNAPEITAATIKDGWLHTGDAGYRDQDGDVFLSGRYKEMIRRRGENISAFDIECRVNTHPAVLECAAYGVPSELEEEDVKLAVVLRPGATLDAEELTAYCAEQLPAFMVPRYVEFLDDLPRTATDKIAKYQLRRATGHQVTPAVGDEPSVAAV